MAAKDIAVKKYVVKLSEAEPAICKGDQQGQKPRQAAAESPDPAQGRCSEHGEGWSDGRIVEALDTNMSMVTRVRQQFVEEGLEAVLSRKQRASARDNAHFDGEKEARLTALACSTPPEGHARWTLRLLEDKVVELGIVERASDNTIGRVLKKTRFSLTAKSNGSSRRRPMALS